MASQNSPQVLIILGAARSGTKILRDTFSQPAEISHIPYDINYIWKYGNLDYNFDDLDESHFSQNIGNYIQRQFVKLSSFNKNPKSHSIVEKTVASPLRIPFILKVFPNAKFIHLVRDGRDVVESNLRMWHQKPDIKYLLKKLRYFPISNVKYATWYVNNIIKGKLKKQEGGETWGPRYSGIDDDCQTKSLSEVCAIQWKKCVESASSSLRVLDSSRYLTVRYEDFVSKPEVLEQMLNFAEVKNPEAALNYWTENVSAGSRGKWERLKNNVDFQKAEVIIDSVKIPDEND